MQKFISAKFVLLTSLFLLTFFTFAFQSSKKDGVAIAYCRHCGWASCLWTGKTYPNTTEGYQKAQAELSAHLSNRHHSDENGVCNGSCPF